MSEAMKGAGAPTPAMSTATPITTTETEVKTMNKSIVAQAVKASSGAPSLQWFAPLATGEMGSRQYLTWLSQQSAVSQEGRSYSALFAANGAAPFAVSNVTKLLWAAQKVGAIGYAPAVGAAKQFQRMVEAVTHSLSAQVGYAVPEISAAQVRIRTEQQTAAAAGSTSKEEEVEEALEECRRLLEAKEISRDDYELLVRHFEEERREQALAAFMQQSEMASTDADRPSEDEGGVQVALHEAADLWQYDAKDIVGAEGLMVSALHSFKGMDLPLDDDDWPLLLERVAESLAVAVDYARPEEREDMEIKAEFRLAVAEKGISANPWKARWVVNYLARRIWRDREVLRNTIQRFHESIDGIQEVMAREQKYNLPARMTRIMTERPIESDEERQYYLVWKVIPESQVQPDSLEYRDEHSGNMLNKSQGEYRMEVYANLLSEAEELMAIMDRLYTEVRAVDTMMLPIWKEMARGPMPAQPPVYWNQTGFYLTEEEARAALLVELEALREQRLEATVEGAHAYLEALLAAQGLV